MTRDEHIKVIREHREAQKRLFKESMALYDEHIKPLEMQRTDSECYLAECRYMGRTVEALDTEIEIEDLGIRIRSREIEVGLADAGDREELIIEQIEAMKENAKLELTEYEYWTSSIPDMNERLQYFAKFGLVQSTIFRMTDVVTVNNLNKNFDQDKHVEFLNGIAPYMPYNQTLDGMEVVHFIFEMQLGCTLAYRENTWYLLMEEDIVFEHENLQDVLEYRNIVG